MIKLWVLFASAGGQLKEVRKPPSVKLRRHLKGRFGKVYGMHWAGDLETLVSASQDGKLILWNAITNLKTITLLRCDHLGL